MAQQPAANHGNERGLAKRHEQVILCANWVEGTDEPDDRLAQAALRMGELISTRPAAPIASLASDPAYRTLLTGHRRAFGIACQASCSAASWRCSSGS